MSKAGNWVPMDKGAVKTLGNIGRPYSVVEALFSHTVDIDCGKPWTINGYAKVWQWSRGKVRRFLDSLRTHSGHLADRKGTQSGHPVHLIDKGLWDEADTKRTQSGHKADSKRDTTSNPKTKPKEKIDGPDGPAQCPHKDIIALYHRILPTLTTVKIWTDSRKGFLRTRWREEDERQNLEWWEQYFKDVSASDFLTGKTAKPFKCDLEWLIRPSNFTKVLEGKYKNDTGQEPEDDYIWGQGAKDGSTIPTDGAGSTAAARINKPRFAT